MFVSATDLAEVERTGRRPGLDALGVTTSLDRSSAVLSGATAAWVWGLPRPRAGSSTVHLTDPYRWRRGRGWLMTKAGLPDDEVTLRGAYRVTTAARTVVDLARTWPEVHAVAAVDAALLRRLTTREELDRTLERQSTVPGIPRAVRAVALADSRAESWLETWGRLTFAALGTASVRAPGGAVGGGTAAEGGGRLVSGTPPWRSSSTGGSSTDDRVRPHPRGRAVAGEAQRGPAPLARRPVRPRRRRRPVVVAAVQGSTASCDVSCPPTGRTVREFREVPRQEGRFRGEDAGDDGWLARVDDGVGTRRTG